MTTKTLTAHLRTSACWDEVVCTVEVERRTYDQPGGITDLTIDEVDGVPFGELDLEDQLEVSLLLDKVLDSGAYEIRDTFDVYDDEDDY